MKNILIFIALFYCNITLSGQVKLQSGSLDFLKGTEQKNIKIEFYYKNLKIKNLDENTYIEKYIKLKNENMSKSGDIWAENWHINKIKLWEPEFESYFNSTFPDRNIQAKINNENAEFILIVSLMKLEPGFFIGYTEQPSSLSSYIIFKQAIKPDSIIAVVKIENAMLSNGLNTNEMYRISNSFGATGQKLGKFILENCR